MIFQELYPDPRTLFINIDIWELYRGASDDEDEEEEESELDLSTFEDCPKGSKIATRRRVAVALADHAGAHWRSPNFIDAVCLSPLPFCGGGGARAGPWGSEISSLLRLRSKGTHT